MTERRAEEIERRVFYRHIESIIRTLEQCEDTPELIDFMLDKCVLSDSRTKVRKRLEEVCDMAIKAIEQTTWIPMVRRDPMDEEKAEYFAQNGEELCYMLENEMPLNGQEVLVSIGNFVIEDVFDEDFYNFENNDIENVDAWMPLPEPYKGE